jgi:hypothetical protein
MNTITIASHTHLMERAHVSAGALELQIEHTFRLSMRLVSSRLASSPASISVQ